MSSSVDALKPFARDLSDGIRLGCLKHFGIKSFALKIESQYTGKKIKECLLVENGF